MPDTRESSFVLGVNYPWLRYGQDFGESSEGHLGASLPENQDRIEQDFVRMHDCGVAAVRWFLFGDGRGGFTSKNGIPQAPDAFLFRDVAAVLQLAERHQLKLCFSLIDYLWLQDRRGPALNLNHKILQFAAGREAFLENVLVPLFREFRAHPAIFAWEIANEPEWAIREFHPIAAAKMRIADFRVFATELARAVHEFAAVPVTMGSARLMWMRAWREVGLDFYQAHYYPAAERGAGDLTVQLASYSRLDKPLFLGEVPARDLAETYSLAKTLDTCNYAGVLGAAVWRWTEPSDADTDQSIGAVKPEILAAWHSTDRPQDQRV